jgi:hypothetical protein
MIPIIPWALVNRAKKVLEYLLEVKKLRVRNTAALLRTMAEATVNQVPSVDLPLATLAVPLRNWENSDLGILERPIDRLTEYLTNV